MSDNDSRTVHLHRVFKAPPSRVFRAFTDPNALVRWSPPYGFLATIEDFDFRVGGGYKMSFINFGTQADHSFSVKYLEIVPDKRLVYIDAFADPKLAGDMEGIVELTPVLCGTELRITQKGMPEGIPLEFCYLGWQESLDQLTRLVEPDIPNPA